MISQNHFNLKHGQGGEIYSCHLHVSDSFFSIRLIHESSSITWGKFFFLKQLYEEDKNWCSFNNNEEFYEFLKLQISRNEVLLEKVNEQQNLIFKQMGKTLSLTLLQEEPKKNSYFEAEKTSFPKKNTLTKKNSTTKIKIVPVEDFNQELLEWKISPKSNDQSDKKFFELSGLYFIRFNDDENYVFSNNNKSLQKKMGGYGWRGFRSQTPELNNNELYFSIKLDIIDQSSNIMLGWCLQNANHLNGYYNTKSSFCIFLYNGKFYNRNDSSEFVQKGIKGKEGDIYSTKINIISKQISFYLKGSLIGEPKQIDLKENEINLLCPFVDLYSQGDKISIIDEALFL